MCSHCALGAGQTKEDLAPNTEIAEESQVVDFMLNADKMLDY